MYQCISEAVSEHRDYISLRLSGENPSFQRNGGRNPHLDHHHQHPDRTADLSSRHLYSLEGKHLFLTFPILKHLKVWGIFSMRS